MQPPSPSSASTRVKNLTFGLFKTFFFCDTAKEVFTQLSFWKEGYNLAELS